MTMNQFDEDTFQVEQASKRGISFRSQNKLSRIDQRVFNRKQAAAAASSHVMSKGISAASFEKQNQVMAPLSKLIANPSVNYLNKSTKAMSGSVCSLPESPEKLN